MFVCLKIATGITVKPMDYISYASIHIRSVFKMYRSKFNLNDANLV